MNTEAITAKDRTKREDGGLLLRPAGPDPFRRLAGLGARRGRAAGTTARLGDDRVRERT